MVAPGEGAACNALLAHDALPDLHTPQRCFCVRWGLSPTATAPALHTPQPGQCPSSELGYQWGLGTWVCKPQPALLCRGAQGTMAGGPGEGRTLWWGDGLCPAQPTLGDQYGQG